MTGRFIDTNIFIRHLVNDDPIQSPASRALFQSIEDRQVTAWTTNLVVAEAVYVLSSKQTYNLGREAIRDALLPLLKLPGFDLPDKGL
jgi:predicted nucleic acid-binding protein